MLLSLAEQVEEYKSTRRMVICDDFNGRCGGLLETLEIEWSRPHMDEVMNTQGEVLIDTGLVIVNDRKGKEHSPVYQAEVDQ